MFNYQKKKNRPKERLGTWEAWVDPSKGKTHEIWGMNVMGIDNGQANMKEEVWSKCNQVHMEISITKSGKSHTLTLKWNLEHFPRSF